MWPVRTVEEHQAVVAALLAPLGGEEVPLAAAHNRVLARDVTAQVSLPGFDNSAMDGYAARSAELAALPVRLPVADDVPAGRTDVRPLAPGTVQRIMTGAPLPDGADVVVPVELTDGATDVVEIRDAPAAGTHLRHAGEDITAGTVALTAGTPLGAAQLGLAAAVGATTLEVHRRPRRARALHRQRARRPRRAAAARADLRVQLRAAGGRRRGRRRDRATAALRPRRRRPVPRHRARRARDR
jgi:molybdopterin molybdochelatase